MIVYLLYVLFGAVCFVRYEIVPMSNRKRLTDIEPEMKNNITHFHLHNGPNGLFYPDEHNTRLGLSAGYLRAVRAGEYGQSNTGNSIVLMQENNLFVFPAACPAPISSDFIANMQKWANLSHGIQAKINDHVFIDRMRSPFPPMTNQCVNLLIDCTDFVSMTLQRT